MGVTTVMIVVMTIWCGATIWLRGATLPPFELNVSNEAMGWLGGTGWEKKIGMLGILIAFGHSILAMSGEESLAQVNREIAYRSAEPGPRRLRDLPLQHAHDGPDLVLCGADHPRRTCACELRRQPDRWPRDVRVGPLSVRLALRAFVVVVGFLILAGAVNTAIVGFERVLNRVAEDRVLPDWFRLPHRRYGTTHRLINLVVGCRS